MDTVTLRDYSAGMKIDKSGQFSVSSHVIIRRLMAQFREEMRLRGRDCFGRSMSLQAIINGLIVWLQTMPEAERYGVIDGAVRTLENLVIGHPVPGFANLTEEDRKLIRAAMAGPRRTKKGSTSGPKTGGLAEGDNKRAAGKRPGVPKR